MKQQVTNRLKLSKVAPHPVEKPAGWDNRFAFSSDLKHWRSKGSICLKAKNLF